MGLTLGEILRTVSTGPALVGGLLLWAGYFLHNPYELALGGALWTLAAGLYWLGRR